jgi:hypothetical protein
MYAAAALSFLGLLASRGINTNEEAKANDTVTGKV